MKKARSQEASSRDDEVVKKFNVSAVWWRCAVESPRGSSGVMCHDTKK